MLRKVDVIKFGDPYESIRTTFESPWGKLRNSLGMKLTSDVTLLFHSAVDNDLFVYFLCYKCGLSN